eukprot:6171046-Ditylum_brightwellii.AAC.1
MRRFKTLTTETLKESSVINFGKIDELMALKERYLIWYANMDARSKSIKEVFTQALCDKFLLETKKAKYKAAEKTRQIKEEEEAKVPAVAKTTKTKEDWINNFYKVDTKEIPKLSSKQVTQRKNL